jgi:hypothetical protein
MRENFRREELIEQCIIYGMPVTGDEDVETLENYLNLAYEDDKLSEDVFKEEIFEDEYNEKKRSGNLLSKIVSLFI